MNKFTPGPWEIVHRDDDYSMCMTVIAPKGAMTPTDNVMCLSDDPDRFKAIAVTNHQISPCVGLAYNCDELCANARLISKAPEMFELLKEFKEWVRIYSFEVTEETAAECDVIYGKAMEVIKEIENV